MTALSVEDFQFLMEETLPLSRVLGLKVRDMGDGAARVAMSGNPALNRPSKAQSGGTISGPALMALADIALWGAVLSKIGRVEMAVTTDLNFHFLAMAGTADVIAEATLFKIGKRLAIGEVAVRREADGVLVMHASGSYSIPPHAS